MGGHAASTSIAGARLTPPSSTSELRDTSASAHAVPRRTLLTVAAVGAAAFMAVYIGVGSWVVRADLPQHTLATPLDGRLPLMPSAMLLYGLLYGQILAPLAYITDRRVMWRAGAGCVSLFVVSVPVWIVWPVTMPRVEVPVTDTLSWGLALMRYLDPPTNCFPSLHVAESFFAALVVRRHDRPVGDLMLGFGVAIWASTLLLGQHWVVDGVAGLALALAADHWFLGRRPLPPAAWRGGRRRWLWIPVGAYGLAFVLFALPWWLGLEAVIRVVMGG
ncbi:MAG: membrane-associated phospholipid phosphatase [Myxococcota bacterium]|jgi:membrane-associated phospholipid phosphatase